MKYTGNIPIPDLTKGLEMIPQAVQYRGQLAAAREKARAEKMAKANENRAKVMAALGSFDQNFHPLAKEGVMDAYGQLQQQLLPLMFQENGYLKAQPMVDQWIKASSRYLLNEEMTEAWQKYPLYLDQSSDAYQTRSASLPADRMLYASENEMKDAWNYQTKGLMSDIEVKMNPDGSFVLMGMPLDRQGNALSAAPIDMRLHQSFNDPNQFDPSTMLVAPKTLEVLGNDLGSQRKTRGLLFNWDEMTANHMEDLEAPIQFTSTNKDSEVYQFRLAAFDRYENELRQSNSNAQAMNRDDLQQVFSLSEDYKQKSPVLYEAVKDILRKAWDNDVKNQAEYIFRTTGRSSQKTLEDLSRNAVTSTYHIELFGDDRIKLIPGFNDYNPGDTANTDKYDGDAGKFQLNMVNLKNIAGDTMVDIQVNMYNKQYYKDAQLFLDAGILMKSPNTGEFVPTNPNDVPQGVVEFLADSGKYIKRTNLMSIGFTSDPNIFIAKGENGMMDVVDINNITDTTDEIYSGLIAGLLQSMPDLPADQNPYLVLREKVMGAVDDDPLGIRGNE